MPLTTRPDFTQVAVGTRVTQICPPLGKGVTVTVYNADTTNVVSVSYSPTGQPSIPIQPLTSAVLDATYALYASAPAGTQPVSLMPGGGSLSPSPAQIAAQMLSAGLAKDSSVQSVATNTTGAAKDATVTGVAKDTTVSGDAGRIAAAGVPILTRSSIVFNTGNATVAANSTATIASQSITQPGYDGSLSLWFSGTPAGNSFSALVTLTWTNSVTGKIVEQDAFYLPIAAGVANPSVITFYGPTYGDTLGITIQNFDTAGVCNYNLTLAQNSRNFVRHIWTWDGNATVTGQAFPSIYPGTNMVGTVHITNLAISGGNTTRLLPFWPGKIRIHIDVSGLTTNQMEIKLIPVNVKNNAAQSLLHVFAGGTAGAGDGALGAQAEFELHFPRDLVQLSVTNNSTVATNTTDIVIQREEY